LRRGCGGFIGSKIKRNQYRKPEPRNGRKSSRKKNQNREEGRRILSESVEENPLEEDPILNRPFCIHSISPVAQTLIVITLEHTAQDLPSRLAGLLSAPGSGRA
jgi:hypothetical protein